MVRPRADRECQHTPESVCGCLSLCVTKIIPPFSVCLCVSVDRLNLTEFKIKSYHSDLEHILVFLGVHGGVCVSACVCRRCFISPVAWRPVSPLPSGIAVSLVPG